MSQERGPTLSVRAKGPLAIFTRPELKTERVSYAVPTPSAVRGLLEAILWKPAILWHVERIWVFNEIRFSSLKRNEINSKSTMPTIKMMKYGERRLEYGIKVEEDRAQRNTIALRDVDYQFDAFFVMTDKAGSRDNVNKFIDMFTRRVEKGQHFHQPYFGCRECIAEIHPPLPAPESMAINDTRDLGIMLWDIDFGSNGKPDNTPLFFHAQLEKGRIEVPRFPIGREEVPI